jgi:oligoendopeptidase F
VAELDAQGLLAALVRYEQLQEKLHKPQCYAQLLFAANSDDDAIKELSQKASEFGNLMSRELLFFELELMAIADDRFAELSAGGMLAPYGHCLDNIRKFRSHSLPEREEQLLKQKSLAGVDAFSRLFDELSASFRYQMELEGETREFSGEELLGLLHHHDAAVRERGFSTFLDRHAKEGIVFNAIFNNITLDHGQELELRHYATPMEPTNIGNELASSTVTRLLSVTEGNYPLAREYFRLKADLLGISPMKNSDIYAPLPECARSFSFEEARELVLAAYGAFNPGYVPVLDSFFTERRIDVYPRTGKGGGAFCMGMTPALPPYVLLNFTGNLRDVSTLAHELGHGLHFVRAQQQSLLNYHPPLPLAETASVFGEMLLTRLLLDREPSRQLRTSLLCARIEDIIATTFRQVVLTRFEEQLHLRRQQKLLSNETICDLWWEENRKLYGDTVEMIPSYRWGWSYISHFIHARFYCYSYTFAELLVLSLYQQYLQQGEAFTPRYDAILASGGSLSPADTVALAGVSLDDPDFWQQGYDYLGTLITELKELAG